MSNMLPTPYQQFIHKSRYARWLEKAVEYLFESGEVRPASWLLSHLPQDRFSPPNANSAAQKLRKEPMLQHTNGVTQDLNGHQYACLDFWHIGVKIDEE